MRKLVASTTIAASMIGGGAAALTLAPTGAGAQDGETPAESESELQSPGDSAAQAGSKVSDVLDGLVEDGTLDQAQRDAVEEALRDARPDFEAKRRHHHRGPARILNGEVLEELGLEPDSVRDGLMNGQTLGEIAEANGSSVEALVGALTEQINDRLDEAVASGRIDETEANERRAEIDARIEELVNQEFERFGRRGPGKLGTDSGNEEDLGA